MIRKAKQLKIVSSPKEMYILLENEEIINYGDTVKKFNMDFDSYGENEFYVFFINGDKMRSKKVRNPAPAYSNAMRHIKRCPTHEIYIGKTILEKKTKKFHKVVSVINHIKAKLI